MSYSYLRCSRKICHSFLRQFQFVIGWQFLTNHALPTLLTVPFVCNKRYFHRNGQHSLKKHLIFPNRSRVCAPKSGGRVFLAWTLLINDFHRQNVTLEYPISVRFCVYSDFGFANTFRGELDKHSIFREPGSPFDPFNATNFLLRIYRSTY